MFSLAITDFGLYLSANLTIIIFILFLLAYLMGALGHFRVNIAFLIYGVCIALSININSIYYSSFNYLLLVPLISHIIFSVILRSRLDLIRLFDSFVRILLIIYIFVAIFEIAVKINGYQYFNYIEFIRSYGDMRLDVLRVRTLFGSSLSTAAIAIFFTIYFFIFKRSVFFIGLSLALVLLSGSRTGFVIFILLAFYNILKISRKGKISIFGLVAALASSIGIFLVVYLSPVGRIAARSTNVVMDASFSGRSSTTVDTFFNIIFELPSSFFIGLQVDYLSDSAITSIMAGSGVFAFLCFFLFLMYLLSLVSLRNPDKAVIFVVFLLGSLMIGDFFVPAVTFMYVLAFLTYKSTSSIVGSRPRVAVEQ